MQLFKSILHDTLYGVEDNGTWKIFQVIQVDDSISIRFFYTTLAVKVY